jgi:hypothetical protein
MKPFDASKWEQVGSAIAHSVHDYIIEKIDFKRNKNEKKNIPIKNKLRSKNKLNRSTSKN